MWFVYLHLCVFVLLENLRSSRTTVTAHEIAFKVQHGALNHNEPCAVSSYRHSVHLYLLMGGGIVLLQILTKYPSHIIVLFISGISSSNLKAKG